jgi:hypothetical protein
MEALLSNWFFNPGLVAGGAALLASPIIIHLLNRMRYRRVRFAAMEFLLQSQSRNRQRLLLEQLLLLLLRILIVAAIVLLVARLILDPSQLSIFRGGRTHHLVLLDDSASMRDRSGETSAYAEALEIVQGLVAEGARRPDTQQFSLALLSNPEQPIFTQRQVDRELVLELSNKLDPRTFVPTHQAGDFAAALGAARKLLEAEKATVRQLHILSDFRSADWESQPAIPGLIRELTALGVTVNLVRTVAERNANLSIVDFSGATHVSAVGVPVRLSAVVRNDGTEVATNVRLKAFDNGVALPATLSLERIEPGAEAEVEFEVNLATEGPHLLRATIEGDSFLEDNERFLAIRVAPTVPVLVIDGNVASGAGEYLVDALAADSRSTGVTAELQTVDYLRQRSIEDFRAVYLVNVAELPSDALESLTDYARRGGGVVWMLGDGARPAWYNETAYTEVIFPVRLKVTPGELLTDPTVQVPDLDAASHPIFAVLQGQDNPFLGSVHVRRFWEVDPTELPQDEESRKQPEVLARLRDGQPLILEHELGSGRIITWLTTADPAWNDWALNPSYVVVQLETLKQVAERRSLPESRTAGEPIELSLDASRFTEEIEILSPSADGQRRTRLQAAIAGAANESNDASPSGTPQPIMLNARFGETDPPGVYEVVLTDQNQARESRLLTYNVPIEEGRLELIESADLLERLESDPLVFVHEVGQRQWVKGEDVGTEVRQGLLIALVLLLLGEQALAYKMSYHPEPVPA